MNIIFTLTEGKLTERHIMEHLFMCRTLNFPEYFSIYQYFYKKYDINFNHIMVTDLDFAECSLRNITKEDIEIIREEYKTWYILEEDIEKEKRIIRIEEKTNINLLEIYTKYFDLRDKIEPHGDTSFFDSQVLCNFNLERANYLKSSFIENIININLEIDNKNEKILIKQFYKIKVLDKKRCRNSKMYHTLITFTSHIYLFDIFHILNYCIERNKINGLYILPLVSQGFYRLGISKIFLFNMVYKILLKLSIKKNLDDVLCTMRKNKNDYVTLNSKREMHYSVSILNIDNDKIRDMLYYIIKLI